MTAPSIRQLIQDVILESGPQTADALPDSRTIASALLASPLADIIDLAVVGMVDGLYADPPPEIRALLVDWLAPR